MILVSACLAGINCKYNGKNNYNEKVFKLVKEGKAIPVCPEQMGGLTTPRQPSEIKIIDGKKIVINSENKDVTKHFERGAIEVLELSKFDNKLVSGNGILVDLLLENGIEVVNSEDM